jgi:hypothetical protein
MDGKRGHVLVWGADCIAERMARHPATDGHHDVDDELRVPVDGGLAELRTLVCRRAISSWGRSRKS